MADDPFRSFNFTVEIAGETIGGFSDISGLSAEGDFADYREGSDLQQNVRKLIGLRKYTPIVLKRGYTKNRKLWDWYDAVRKGKPERTEVTITLQNEEHVAVLRWSAENAWVNKIEGPTMKAGANEVAIESVEIIHEGLTLEVVESR